MSGGLAPSKSTVYVSNVPYCLTNNDLHQVAPDFIGKYPRVKKTRSASTDIFGRIGKVVK
ncbi:unnamed protein product [Clavelina lepadiformis]|uniref:RRM domain-containing protein n=1 Tax=Clavelina lepadiformis TaxID=159417 RepID=A0ABP0G3W1_CLALP